MLLISVNWSDMHLFLTARQSFIFHDPVRYGKERVIGAHFYIQTWFNPGAALADENISGKHLLTGEFFYAQPLGIAIAAVTT